MLFRSHHLTARIYALKNIYDNQEETVRHQIYRKIDILRTADSPFVVHDMYDQGGEIQIILEYMDVGSLNNCCITSEIVLTDVTRRRPPLPPTQSDRPPRHQAY